VILLMFGVGLHFSFADLMAVRRIAIPGAIGQIALATAIGAGMAVLWGWSFGGGLVLGLSLSVASTVVLLKALEERNAVTTTNGRIAVGWLIVEDLAMVLALVLLPALASVLGGEVPDGHAAEGRPLLQALGLTLVKVAAFATLVLLLGPRLLPPLLKQVARTGSRELFTLAVLSIALGIAFGSAMLFGVSMALGAFFAGMVLNESALSHKAATNSLPLQDAFAVLFFVSVGMLFDPAIVLREPLLLAGVLLLVLVGKSLVAMCIVLALGYPFGTALTVSAALAQIGEFSFILAGIGVGLGLLPPDGFSLILAAALLSITLNPLAFAAVGPIGRWVRRRPEWRQALEEARMPRYVRLEAELAQAREQAEQRASAQQVLSPQQLLERFPLFSGLTPEQLEVVGLHFHAREARPGERVIRSGDAADAVYFISSGQVQIAVAGKKITLGAGDFFGEMALLGDQPRSANVTAIDYCRFLTLDRGDFREILRRYPEIHAHMSDMAARRDAMNRQPAGYVPVLDKK
jgi:CPA2 family monovalent cation:H+ antiporter-2